MGKPGHNGFDNVMHQFHVKLLSKLLQITNKDPYWMTSNGYPVKIQIFSFENLPCVLFQSIISLLASGLLEYKKSAPNPP